MGFRGLKSDRVRKLAGDLDKAGRDAPGLHRRVAGILKDAEAALDGGKKATNSPELQKIQHSTSPGVGAQLPGSLGEELPAIAKEVRRRCDMADEAGDEHGFGQGITPLDAFNGVAPLPEPKPKKKGWFEKYISDPFEHGIEDVGDFMSSVFSWRNMLDAGSVALGAFLMAAGGAMEVGGGALDITGVGALIGVPINIAGVAVIGTGGALALAGFGDFITRMSEGDTGNAWDRSGKQGTSGDAADPVPISEEQQEAFTQSQQELSGLSKNKQIAEVNKGIEKDGQKFKPEGALTKGAKHGIDWNEGPQRAKVDGKPQGRFGSPADVKFATEKGAELGPGKTGFFKLPKGNECVEYMPDGSIRKPNSVFVKVRPNGTIHAYPTTR